MDNPRTATVALVCVVRNEVHRIADWMRLNGSNADQVIVVDTGSDDGTAHVAEVHGAEVVRLETDDMSTARNHGDLLARCDWILHLDADEEIDAQSWRRLSVDLSCGPTVDAISLSWFTYLGASEFSAVRVHRLYRAGRGISWQNAFHESIKPALRSLGSRVVRSPAIIRHLEATEPLGHRAKRLRNIDRLTPLLDDTAHPAYPMWSSLLALDHWALDDRDTAHRLLERALDVRGLSGLTAVVWARVAVAEHRWKDIDETIEPASTRVGGLDPQLVLALVEARIARGRWADARTLLTLYAAMENTVAVGVDAALLELAAGSGSTEEVVRALDTDPYSSDPRLPVHPVRYSSHRLQTAFLSGMTEVRESPAYRRFAGTWSEPRPARTGSVTA